MQQNNVRATSLATAPSMGDMAVDGLLHGLAGGFVMILFLLASGALTGRTPGELLSLFGVDTIVQPLNGLLSHLAVSAIYGILWGLFAGMMARPALPPWLWGLMYGSLLYGAATVLVLPVSPLAQLPWLLFLAAHWVYGGVLGLLQQRVHPAA